MGCCGSRKLSTAKVESLLINVEKSLTLALYTCKEIDRIMHRHSFNLKISQTQFSVICKDLKIEQKSDTYNLLQLFYKPSEFHYSAIELSSLGILLGIGSKEEKIELLFQNYDEDTSNELETEEIINMLNHLMTISFGYLLTHASRVLKDYEIEIIEFKQSLLRVKTTMISFFQGEILGEDIKTMNSTQFTAVFEKPELLCLLNPHELRKNTRQVTEMISATANMVEQAMENPEKMNLALERFKSEPPILKKKTYRKK